LVGMGRLLAEVATRLQKKTHLHLMMIGWERRIGIVTEDTKARWHLTFSKGGAFCGAWSEEQSVDLIVHGDEREMQMLFGGDELVYTLAREQVRIVGPLRDQLKLDAILRLTCK